MPPTIITGPNYRVFAFSLLLLLFLYSGLNAQQYTGAKTHFVLTANLKGLGNKPVVIEYSEFGEKWVADTIKANNGKFSFDDTIPGTRCYFFFPYNHGKRPHSKDVFGIFADANPATFTGDIKHPRTLTLKGSKLHDDFLDYNKGGVLNYLGRIMRLQKRYRVCRKLQMAGAQKKLQLKLNALRDSMKQYDKVYISRHPNLVFSAIRLSGDYPSTMTTQEAGPLYDTLSAEVKQTIYAQRVKTVLDAEAKTSPGQMIRDIALPDTSGQTHNLFAWKGKMVLVDFWASWCGPCRRENPVLVKAYKRFHPKGLEIFSISLDTERKKWLAAVAKDSLPWTNVSDLNGFSDLAAELGVKSIPSNLLIDGEGRIVAKNLRGEALEKKLEELLH